MCAAGFAVRTLICKKIGDTQMTRQGWM
jgi:hypothetical protein